MSEHQITSVIIQCACYYINKRSNVIDPWKEDKTIKNKRLFFTLWPVVHFWNQYLNLHHLMKSITNQKHNKIWLALITFCVDQDHNQVFFLLNFVFSTTYHFSWKRMSLQPSNIWAVSNFSCFSIMLICYFMQFYILYAKNQVAKIID